MLTEFVKRKGQDWARTKSVSVPVDLGDAVVGAINDCLDDYEA